MSKTLASLRQSHAATRNEQGFSVIELLVSMMIFTVLLAVMMSVIVSMNANVDKTRSIADAAAQGQRAINVLDKQVRYADWINPQASGATDKYVSFEGLTPTGVVACYQWRLHTGGILQQRTWDPATLPTSSVTATNPAWTPVATGVVNTVAAPPFTVTIDTLGGSSTQTSLGFQQLAVDLVMQGKGKAVGHAETKLVMTARNSNYPPGNSPCAAVTP